MATEVVGYRLYQPHSLSHQRYNHSFALPLHLRPTSFGIGISILAIGVVSIILGGIAYTFYGHFYNPSVLIGLDIWVGVMVYF